MGQLVGVVALLWVIGKAFGWHWVAGVLLIAAIRITLKSKDH